MTLQGQRALVTGGGRGLGRAIAAGLTQAGAVVSILGRDEATLKEAVAAGVAADCAACDVRDEASVSAALDKLSRQHAFDIAVANAGRSRPARSCAATASASAGCSTST